MKCAGGACPVHKEGLQAEWKRQMEVGSVAYRDHRGSLRESMATMQRFETEDALRVHLVRHYGEIQTLEYKHVGMDDRIGWDTWYVLVNGLVVGMVNGLFLKPGLVESPNAKELQLPDNPTSGM